VQAHPEWVSLKVLLIFSYYYLPFGTVKQIIFCDYTEM
jgi:hypothetical protein